MPGLHGISAVSCAARADRSRMAWPWEAVDGDPGKTFRSKAAFAGGTQHSCRHPLPGICRRSAAGSLLDERRGQFQVRVPRHGAGRQFSDLGPREADLHLEYGGTGTRLRFPQSWQRQYSLAWPLHSQPNRKGVLGERRDIGPDLRVVSRPPYAVRATTLPLRSCAARIRHGRPGPLSYSDPPKDRR